jgi:hypothetical protein
MSMAAATSAGEAGSRAVESFGPRRAHSTCERGTRWPDAKTLLGAACLGRSPCALSGTQQMRPPAGPIFMPPRSKLDKTSLSERSLSLSLQLIGNPQDRKGVARRSPWGTQRLYVDDAHWQQTVTRLARDADRIVLCIDASDGVRWEIAHVLHNGHARKTYSFSIPRSMFRPAPGF